MSFLDNPFGNSSMSNSTTTSSSSTIGTTAVFNIALFVIFITSFLFLRPRHKNVYQPRVVVKTIPEDSKPRPLASGIFAWFKDLLSRPDSEILRDAGLDGYFFLRYLRFVFIICLVGVVILFPVLLAVNATGGGTPHGATNSGFDILSFVNNANPNRYYAHALLGYFFFGFVLFTLYRELQYYVSVRQSVLTSPAYSNLISSRTILLTTLPDDYKNSKKLASLFDGVKFVFITKDAKKLRKKVEKRAEMAGRIESAEVKLLKTAVKNRLKYEKKPDAKKTPIQGDDIEVYVPNKKRPTRRLKPIIGKKVDTINHDSEELSKINDEIEQLQDSYGSSKNLNSAFITFYTQEQAEVGFQTLSHHQPLHMAPRFIGIKPDDIIWSNLRIKWWERLVRELATTFAILAVIVFWTIPVGFVGFISNVKNLQEKWPWLDFLNNLPPVLMGLVTGLLPTILLALLMMLLPVFIRFMGRISGVPSNTRLEYYTQSAYFAFQIVQVFLVTTLTSGAAAAIDQIIHEPASAMSILATNLPKASNFYIAYFLLQGFSVCGGMLVQIVSLILFYVLGFALDGTPRKKWSRYNIITGLGWGTVFPVYTNLAVISITYALISPLILIFSAMTFGLIYLAYLHNLMFVQSPSDGRGIYYSRAILQTFSGLYIGQICLLGLFVLAKSWGPLVLQAVFLCFTVFVNVSLKSAFDPLLFQLPRSLLRGQNDGDDDNNESASLLSETHHHHEAPSSPVNPFEKSATNATTTTATTTATTTTNKNNAANNVPLTTELSNVPINDPEQGYNNSSHNSSNSNNKLIGPIPSGGAIVRYFKPHRFLTPSVLLRELLQARMFHEPSGAPLTNEEESVAYRDPSANEPNPLIWIPRDPWGLSSTQVHALREQNVNISDEGAWFDIDEKKKKSKFAFSDEIDEVPIWTPPFQY